MILKNRQAVSLDLTPGSWCVVTHAFVLGALIYGDDTAGFGSWKGRVGQRLGCWKQPPAEGPAGAEAWGLGGALGVQGLWSPRICGPLSPLSFGAAWLGEGGEVLIAAPVSSACFGEAGGDTRRGQG